MAGKGENYDGSSVIKIKPYFYVHVLDNNTNVTRVEVGPATFVRQDHEKVVAGPDAMITVPPRTYCIISNPVLRDKDGRPIKDSNGQARLIHGDQEIRFAQDPFPLYPGEKLTGPVTPLAVIPPLSALRLRAIRDFEALEGEGKEIKRIAGDEWLYEGPGTYMPHVAVKVVETITATIIRPNQALRLRARKYCKDRQGRDRKAGEEWMVREEGEYLPGVDEEVIRLVDAFVLTERKALHLRATRTFSDVFGKERKAGEEWLVTLEDAETHIPDIYETVVGEVALTTLDNRQYVVVLDPYDANGKQLLGRREVRKGECSFFLRPGEHLEGDEIQSVYVLTEEEALLMRAKEAFKDADTEGKEVKRKPGDRWMIYGPRDYVPSVEVEIWETRRAIPLADNEGVYVRNIKDGSVVKVIGPRSYMLSPYEELWEKDLPSTVEDLLLRDARVERFSDAVTEEPRGSGGRSQQAQVPSKQRQQQSSGGGGAKSRDRTRVVTYHVPANAAAQIYNYKERKAKVTIGPEIVMLGPDDMFTVLSLSGGKPKTPNSIRSVALLLGPDFMTDIIVVETGDHTRLKLQLAYNWLFQINEQSSDEDKAKVFSIPDFVGDACKAIASRVRAAVASIPFDVFHKNSAKIIRTAVFGLNKDGNVNDSGGFKFDANLLVITNVDIQSVEPVDQKTRESLQKSVQLAIEITTNSQEAAARHEAERLEQEAKGRLERQRISDEAEAEKARRELLQLQAESTAVESTGVASAEAKARAEAARIEGTAAVEQARHKAEALTIQSETELHQLTQRQKAEIEHERELIQLEIAKARELAQIESGKIKSTIDAIGTDTIKAIALAGPELQAKLLGGLGLQGYLVTDGRNPINLFSTANGLINALPSSGAPASHS
mmetsp:Transcript_21575/g.35737  ORF Transcript_21575/g.35737 Transcript_21575/m.35737 type:complete len:890 (+) Transcript_21575:109-2778(+)|eukprot:CAMPEP_0184644058 /NCGR_PEP_ID=MMETSP0308-20130426/830_1 /TAXON_ID=38269 /ORGANISM="Gloeochaete witrockiana, Strain SAG 46.84" /LENGTH=889 /DNA_ID=CAMNT_0027072369 /DNA_START=106 /DNA_END=2775 /DNA_ORIENTATION=+